MQLSPHRSVFSVTFSGKPRPNNAKLTHTVSINSAEKILELFNLPLRNGKGSHLVSNSNLNQALPVHNNQIQMNHIIASISRMTNQTQKEVRAFLNNNLDAIL
ncbi:MAG: hypothetical protein VKJ06_05030 [Vampirovibrionales bacterium]|nr:hypothetical protein [Vampirovibrionales bacterium]